MELFQLREVDPELLRRETQRAAGLVRTALPAADVVPVGSTAIPGIIGKQDIDLLARVAAEDFPAARRALDDVLERDREQFSSDDFQGYRVRSELEVAVQLTVAGGPHDVFLPFLEALAADPKLILAYNELKRRWDGRPMEEYRAAKAEFIRTVLIPQRDARPRYAGDQR